MSGGKQETKNSGWKPALDSIKENVLPGINDFASEYAGGNGLWEGGALNPLDPLVTQAQNSQLDMIPGLEQAFGGVTDTLQGFLDYDPNSAQNVARRGALTDNVTTMFNESIRPGIEDRGTFSGQFGTPQGEIALGRATDGLSRSLSDAEVSIMEGDRNRAFQAMGMAPSILSSTLMPSQIMGDIGTQRTQRGQQELLDEIFQYEQPRNNELRHLAETSGLLSPLTGLSTTVSAPGGSPLQGALGGAAAGSAFGPWGAAAGGVIGGLGAL